jgi:hypothetical protein
VVAERRLGDIERGTQLALTDGFPALAQQLDDPYPYRVAERAGGARHSIGAGCDGTQHRAHPSEHIDDCRYVCRWAHYPPVRTLIISDLHLGMARRNDVLRLPGGIEPLLAELEQTDRLVLLGDTLELRDGAGHAVLSLARPPLEQIADALPRDATVVICAGNHDHGLIAPFLQYGAGPLGLESDIRLTGASPTARSVAALLGAERTSFRYPGVWLRDDVYAMHGHYGDVHTTMPQMERLAAGVMSRLGKGVPAAAAEAEDYERVQAPIYAWADSVGQHAEPDSSGAANGGYGARAYALIKGSDQHPVVGRVTAAGFPLAIKGLSAALGPLSPDLSPTNIRRSGIKAVEEVIRRLGIDAQHVISGHTHRAGPLPEDDPGEWRTASGIQMHNSGNWVYEEHFMPTPSYANSPYWPGSAIVLEDEGPPRLKRLLGDFVVPAAVAEHAALRPG